MNILDFGCGIGYKSLALSRIYKDSHVWGVDILQECIERAKRRYGNHHRLSFLRIAPHGVLPFDDGFFDLVYSCHVLEHVHDLDAVMMELTRVLACQGRFIAEVPHWRSEKFLLKINPTHLEEHYHVRIFEKGNLESLLKNYSLQIIRSRQTKAMDNLFIPLDRWLSGRVVNQLGERERQGLLSRMLFWGSRLFDRDLPAIYRFHHPYLVLFTSPLWAFTLPLGMMMDKIFPETNVLEAIKVNQGRPPAARPTGSDEVHSF